MTDAPSHRRRSRLGIRQHRSRPGTAPGTLIASEEAVPVSLRLIAYRGEHFEEKTNPDLSEIRAARERGGVLWLDVVGTDPISLLEEIGALFKIHPLVLEDVVNTHQRPKVEVFDDQIFIVTRMPVARNSCETEQVAMLLGTGHIVTFQEKAGDCFEPVRDRLRRGRPRLRSSGADYLAYALLDSVVDHYFPVLEHYGEYLEALEDRLPSAGSELPMVAIYDAKRDLLALRRALWPQREMLSAIMREETALVTKSTRIFLRDVYDHVIQQMDMLETYREIASGLVDMALSFAGMRMNEIMKVLTVIATIFIPLSFIAGVYGMNFDSSISRWNMPELHWRYGYPFALALMVAVAAGLVWYLRRKRWL